VRLTKQFAEFHKGFWETAGKNEHMQKQKRERRENRVPQSIVYIVIRLMIDQAFKCVEKYSKPVMETKKNTHSSLGLPIPIPLKKRGGRADVS
jgi:hypothetical protein